LKSRFGFDRESGTLEKQRKPQGKCTFERFVARRRKRVHGGAAEARREGGQREASATAKTADFHRFL